MTLTATAKPAASKAQDGFLARLGQVATDSPRFFWFAGHTQGDFEAASDLIEQLKARHPRVDILLTAPTAATRNWLRARFPQSLVLPPPLPLKATSHHYIQNLNVRGLALLGALGPGDRAILKGAGKRAIPCVFVESEASGAAVPPDATAERLEHHFVLSEDSESRLLAAGIPAGRITRLGESPVRSADFVEAVSRLLATDLKLLRSTQHPFRRLVEGLGQYCLNSRLLRPLLATKARRYDTLEQLRHALGDPQSILCLGNGPSSGDPAVAEVRHDCLFRVNDLWLKHGLLTRPDMVFTGSKGTLSLVKEAIFGLYTIKSENRLLVAPLFDPRRWGCRYATIERFGLFLSEPRWKDMRPTNGAVMLATAVALQPALLVISGIDLFSHPAGTYPGDSKTPNAYTPGHDAESELALLLEALSRYQGELVILSDPLRLRWEEYSRARATGQRPDSRESGASGGPTSKGRGDLRLA